MSPPRAVFTADNLGNGYNRPVAQLNAWGATPEDARPTVTIEWVQPRSVRRIELVFDTDYDHPMESVLMGHPETVIPFGVSDYRILDEHRQVVVEVSGNHQSQRVQDFAVPIKTRCLTVELTHPGPNIPLTLLAVRAYA